MAEQPQNPDPPSKVAEHPASPYGGLNFPSAESPLQHRGSGWQGMSWEDFMDDTAWQAIHYLNSEKATRQRDAAPSIPFHLNGP